MTNQELRQIADGDEYTIRERQLAREVLDRRQTAVTRSRVDRPLRAQLAATLLGTPTETSRPITIAVRAADMILDEVDRTARDDQ